MAKSKREFIQELIDTAQENIWKNELVIKYRQANPSGDEKKDTVDLKACEHSIEKDKAYIDFLYGQLNQDSV